MFQVELEVGDPEGQRYETISAMVDSGATYTMLPTSFLRELGVEAIESRTFILDDDRRMQRGFGQTWIRIDGRRIASPIVFGDDNAMPLLGAVTLEIFALGIDPVNGRLIPVDSFLL